MVITAIFVETLETLNQFHGLSPKAEVMYQIKEATSYVMTSLGEMKYCHIDTGIV
jgi:hypothetical protein